MATYCVCKKKDEEGVLWISCDKCKGWYHPTCVGLRNDDIDEDNEWFCPLCKNESGSLSQNFGQEWRRCGRTKCKNFVEGDELLCIDCKLVLVERNSNKIKRMRLEETRNTDDVEVESATKSPTLKKEANPLKKKVPSSSSLSRDQKPKFKVQASFKAPKPTSSTSAPAVSKPERTQSPTPTAPVRKEPVASPRPISIDHLLFNSPPKLESVAKRLDSIKDQMKKPIVKSPSLSDNPERSPVPKSPSIDNGKSPMMSPYKKRELEASTTPTSMSMPLKKRFRGHDFDSPASSPIATPTPSKLDSCLSTHVHMSVNSLGTTSSQNEAVSVK